MGIKDLMSGLKYDKNSLSARLDKFLALNVEENDRAVDVNSPSQVFKCKRALFYSRTEAECDGTIDARLQRIFDNGTHVHLRLQEYLKKEGTLIYDEVPCIDEEANIQGHTDGILKITDQEYAILEIKSMNSHQFAKLKEPKEEHIAQALTYCYCTECRRQELRAMTPQEFHHTSYEKRRKFYESRYQHLVGGKKHTREEKIAKNVEENMMLDEVLYDIKRPIEKVYFLYENKDSQEIKEFIVEYDDEKMCDILDFYEEVNYYVKNNILPPREGTSKNCNECRWCSFRNWCWVV